MCGIVTMILKDQTKVFGHEYSEMFKQMMHADAVRGWDSTGIACIKHGGHVHIVKDALTPSELFKKVPDNTWIFQNRVYIGHNRWATRGGLTATNAHPFQEGNISLVHNGTLRAHYTLKNVEVDSHAITHAIAEKGAIETLEILDGAYALVWHDQATGHIHATRNEERPLFLLETEDLFVLSSERGLVYWICERFKIKVRKCAPITPGVLYTFRSNKKNFTIVEQLKYQMLIPMSSYYPSDYTPPPTVVSTIRPHVNNSYDTGLEVGQTLEIIPTDGKDLGYTAFCLGSFRWNCTSLVYPHYRFELYTINNGPNLSGMPTNITITNIYRNGTTAVIICKLNPLLLKDITPNSILPLETLNGVLLTPSVLQQAKDCLCTSCTEPFEHRADIVLFPVHKKGHLYKYTYYCPDCSAIVTPLNLRALH